LPARKGGQQQEALRNCTEKSNFGLYFWPRVTLVTFLKYCNGDYLAWRSILGSKKR
jgi:hypothetical protein